jgi:hypothetical protein
MLIPLLAATLLLPQGQGKGRVPPGHARKEGVPPGLAKKGGLPPGLARKFGPRVPEKPYVAIDPRYTDRAWFLIDGRWELKKGLEASIRLEVRDALKLPPAPPPIPLPKVSGSLHVVLF